MQIRFNISKRRAADEISLIREAALDYLHYAGNADLGEASPRENLRSAFFIIRNRMERGYSVSAAAGDLFRIANSMADM